MAEDDTPQRLEFRRAVPQRGERIQLAARLGDPSELDQDARSLQPPMPSENRTGRRLVALSTGYHRAGLAAHLQEGIWPGKHEHQHEHKHELRWTTFSSTDVLRVEELA